MQRFRRAQVALGFQHVPGGKALMEHAGEQRKRLDDLLNTQKLGVLATQSDGQPYGSLVFFAATPDGREILFATYRATRKYANLVSNPRVAMLVDSRSNRDTDVHQAMAVTATGTVEEPNPSERDACRRIYLGKLPHLGDFVGNDACALLRLKVRTYYLVNRFQEVTEIHPEGWALE